MILLNSVQAWFCNRPVKMIYKVMFVLMIFSGNLYHASSEWIDGRSPTLYDVFNITRTAGFEEIKDAKNYYLEKLKQKEDPDYDGDKFDLLNYTMTKQ